MDLTLDKIKMMSMMEYRSNRKEIVAFYKNNGLRVVQKEKQPTLLEKYKYYTRLDLISEIEILRNGNSNYQGMYYLKNIERLKAYKKEYHARKKENGIS